MRNQVASKYDPSAVEDKWYQYWMDHKLFASKPDSRKPYTIVMPPPNVTGVLHMGHMLNNTIQDILIRRARTKGLNACWVPGTDHASIATEAKVVERLSKQGIHKQDLSREEFLEHAWSWTHEHGGVILSQLKRLGASCDWDRLVFTMDEERSKTVLKVFVDLYEKGLIYRGVHMVNWDPQALTAISDEEVIHKTQQSKLYYCKYQVVEEPNRYIVVATTRPETIFGDTAVCVHPEDERYKWLHGKHVIVPGVGRKVPIITDDYIDIEFGTGCLKVTPAHDINDYRLGQKYHIPAMDILNNDGTLNEHAGKYEGQDRFKVRELFAEELREAGLIDRIEDYENSVGFSERTNVPIEPKLSMQWFLKMEGLARPAYNAVMKDGAVHLVPPKFKSTYAHWLENIRDWCISRQLWWGHRIPAYYLPNGECVVATDKEKALKKAKGLHPEMPLSAEDLTQDPDCLDTWFSSWLWPLSVWGDIFDTENTDRAYYYPTSDLVSGPDILFFWIARMIIAGYEYEGKAPFQNVYLTGIVRDNQGRKMSKSLGNSPDPIALIEKYGADGVRMGLMTAATAGNDILFDEGLCEQGRNFSNKIWNSFRLIQGWRVDEAAKQDEVSKIAVRWFTNHLADVQEQLDDDFAKYRISEAMMLLYKLVKDDFSGIYLELIKPTYGEGIDQETMEKTLQLFEQILILLHPFMPFITEELWQALERRKEGESIMTRKVTNGVIPDHELLDSIALTMEVVSGIRSVRASRNVPNKDTLTLYDKDKVLTSASQEVIKKLTKTVCVQQEMSEQQEVATFMVQIHTFSIPIEGFIDMEGEIAKLREQEAYYEQFLLSIRKKLSNEKFVSKAPEQVVALERKKESDSLEKLESIRKRIQTLSK